MNVLIVGAGKTGRRLALALSGRGYDVAVVDRDQSRLDLLGENFDGMLDLLDHQICKLLRCLVEIISFHNYVPRSLSWWVSQF